MYKLIRGILFLFPPEGVHYFTMNLLKLVSSIPLIRSFIRQSYAVTNPVLAKKVFGLWFRNPVGLGAGFDKNARWLSTLELLGFGFVEIGTVTPLAQAGNDRPRLFRLPKDHALINRMGFNNDGADLIAERIRSWRATKKHSSGKLIEKMLIGGNIGKNKLTPNDDAWLDYVTCFRKLHEHVDFFVINVSSPNTPGLRELQEKEALRKIIQSLQTTEKTEFKDKEHRPLLLKIAPDLEESQLMDILALTQETDLDGLVVSNTTIGREHLRSSLEKISAIGQGGLSGAPLKRKSSDLLTWLARNGLNKMPVIASGGVMSAADAMEKVDAGASLIQVWTGFIYTGPTIVKKILQAILKRGS